MNLNDYDELAKKYLSEEGYKHSHRVYNIVLSNEYIIPESIYSDCEKLALIHDLIEDCPDFNPSIIDEPFIQDALNFISRPEWQSYNSYIQRIADYAKADYRAAKIAWWVKLADIKDHLALKETLKDSLRQRYIAALKILL